MAREKIGANVPDPTGYCTTRANPVVLTVEPLIAVTVRLYVPLGVPGFGGGGGGVLLPAPPQDGITTTDAAKTSKSIIRSCCLLLTSRIENNSPAPVIEVAAKYSRPCPCRSLEVAACVVMATVAVVEPTVPVGFTDDGVIVHVASDGAPEQARVIVPL